MQEDGLTILDSQNFIEKHDNEQFVNSSLIVISLIVAILMCFYVINSVFFLFIATLFAGITILVFLFFYDYRLCKEVPIRMVDYLSKFQK